jgi:UDP-GlcNAc:undecaprenyl-phosphate/decaprenyl-phosphate GlcNAc-1-phosphate transferase
MNLSFTFILTAFFFISFIFSLLINYILLRFSQTLGMRGAESRQVRWNPNEKPSLGGISFYVIFLFSFIFILLISNKNLSFDIQIIGILIASTMAFIMGLADDAFNTQPLLKFLTQLVCGLVILFSGHSITLFQNQFLNYILTVLWVVGLMNSINMLDNMDGITSIVSILICLFMVSVNVSLYNTSSYSNILNLGLLGALCGFLVYNFHPSKMFMGDSGSQFLGLFLAIMGIDHCWNNPDVLHHNSLSITKLVIVALVFILPLTDTFTVVTNRLKAGNSPFIGGKDHTTHHLFFKGITEKRIAILFFIIGLLATILAYRLIFSFSFWLLYLSIFYIVLVFVTLYLNTVLKRK